MSAAITTPNDIRTISYAKLASHGKVGRIPPQTMNTENPTIDEVVEFRDQLLKAREDVLDKFFLLEDLLKDHRDKEPEELRDIHEGLREGDRLLKGINDRLAYTHKLMLKFEDLPSGGCL